ncbi:MAG: hypothetical protein Kow0065_20200 [Methylomicrobium sp.]
MLWNGLERLYTFRRSNLGSACEVPGYPVDWPLGNGFGMTPYDRELPNLSAGSPVPKLDPRN